MFADYEFNQLFDEYIAYDKLYMFYCGYTITRNGHCSYVVSYQDKIIADSVSMICAYNTIMRHVTELFRNS